MTKKLNIIPLSSEYVEEQRRNYSLYILEGRAIPGLADGLKASQRRVLWMARNGAKYKSASLAGATMPIHPHGAPEGAIDTLTMPYGNNIPLFEGKGTFGTRLKPGACGASRYTSVLVSEFTKDVLFKDIDIIPMVDNYDNTLKEPDHFLPIVPISLLNPSNGIAVGFASDILPRDLVDVIKDQILHLKGKPLVSDPPITFHPFDAVSRRRYEDRKGKSRWEFAGTIDRINTTTVRVTNLPYGVSHEKYEATLIKMIENGIILDFTDDSSNVIDIVVKFKRGAIGSKTDEEVLALLRLVHSETENHVLIRPNNSVDEFTYHQVITEFTDWRLPFYIQRYEKLRDDLLVTIQRYRDVITAINKNVGSKARTIKSKAELVEYLESIKIIHTDYIASLPVYRFTEEEKLKVEEKLEESLQTLKRYEELLGSEDERKKVYISELNEILRKHRKK